MSQKENAHPYIAGTEHGTIAFGKVNTFSNEIDACKISNGPDGGRHYIRMQETGSKEDGSNNYSFKHRIQIVEVVVIDLLCRSP